jgi:hypothetical protein
MLDKALAGPRRRRFLNVSTGECIRMDIPELDDDHRLLALTPEGLLLLLQQSTLVVRLLNPLTHQFTEFPRLTELLQARGYESARGLQVYGAGLVADASTLVVRFSCPMVLAVAKPGPGGKSWTVVNKEHLSSVLPFVGRFYCATERGVMVLDITSDHQLPRLLLVADLPFYFSPMGHSLHLVHRAQYSDRKNKRYDVYRVDLEAGLLVPIKSFNGRAVFMGMRRTISVSARVFPFITADIIYLAGECDRRILGYNIADGSIVPCRGKPIPEGWVSPCSIIDCLRNCIRGSGGWLA